MSDGAPETVAEPGASTAIPPEAGPPVVADAALDGGGVAMESGAVVESDAVAVAAVDPAVVETSVAPTHSVGSEGESTIGVAMPAAMDAPAAEPVPAQDGVAPTASAGAPAALTADALAEPALLDAGLASVPATDGAATATTAPLAEEIQADEIPAAPNAADTLVDVVPDTSDLPPAELRAVLEALLFVSTRPLGIERLQQCLPGTSAHYLEGFLSGLAERYDHENRGWELRRIAGGWQLMTRRQLHAWVRQLDRRELPSRLSKSALETLAIVAYKQPITRGQVEDIRGVQCGPVLRQLMDLKLVQVTGRSEDLLGRPLLYATTEHFLGRFGLGGLADLPRKHEFGA